ncbi:MAG: nuclear transport factor 2 family protein [Rhodocyclaceae bacterium]|jgi:steroid delta-isomerase|nr:nuclear transport factor 2 family protein [Rhodocyclaceae bacterium]
MTRLSIEKTRAAVDALVPFYEHLRPEDIAGFDTYYRHDARFRDPFNHVTSIDGIKRIFTHMFTQVNDPAFRVTKDIIGEGDAILFWTFHFRFKGMGCKTAQSLEGVTHLEFDDEGRVTLHRDYWDAAEELYGRLPVIGSLMRGLQRMIRA